jgi:hypothetical protein
MYEYYVEIELPSSIKDLIRLNSEKMLVSPPEPTVYIHEYSIFRKGVQGFILKAWSKKQIEDMFDRRHCITNIEHMRTL